MQRSYGLIASFALVAALHAPPIASAAPCDTSKPLVVIRGASSPEPLINAIAPIAAQQGINIVFSSAGSSCDGGVQSIFQLIPTTTTSGKTKYATDQNATCDLPSDTIADIGVSDIYAQSCTSLNPPITKVPEDVLDYLGPVEAMTVAVHDDPSYPVAINQAAVFNIFGVTARGGDSKFDVAPWNVQADIYARNAGSGTQQTWWRAAGLPDVSKFGGVDQMSAGTMLSALSAAARPSVIGIIAYQDIIAAPGGAAPAVRPLAYASAGQDHAYYPNSTATSHDLLNVRDGHYLPWVNMHFFTKKDTATGKAANQYVQQVLDLFETQEGVAATAESLVVPQCAMKVSRTTDQGELSTYQPETPCGCFFEATSSGQAPGSCTACTDDAGCSADQQCVFGYCEVK